APGSEQQKRQSETVSKATRGQHGGRGRGLGRGAGPRGFGHTTAMRGKLEHHRALIVLWPFVLGCGSEPLDSGDGATEPTSDGRIISIVEPEADAVPAPPPEYPDGPYGTAVGATIANLAFLGWRDPVAAGYDETALEL